MATKQVSKSIPAGNVSTVFTFFRRSTLPVQSGKGMVAKDPAVVIRDTGQIALNTKATLAIEAKAIAKQTNIKYLAFGFHAPSRTLQIRGLINIPKLEGTWEGFTEADFFPVGRGKKSKGIYCGIAGVLSGVGYDFKASGVQTFNCASVADGEVTVVIPEGKLEPKPVVARGPRKPAATSAKPTATPVPAAADEDDDIDLEESEEDGE